MFLDRWRVFSLWIDIESWIDFLNTGLLGSVVTYYSTAGGGEQVTRLTLKIYSIDEYLNNSPSEFFSRSPLLLLYQLLDYLISFTPSWFFKNTNSFLISLPPIPPCSLPLPLLSSPQWRTVEVTERCGSPQAKQALREVEDEDDAAWKCRFLSHQPAVLSLSP